MKLEEMDRKERSLLVYLETRCVDYGGSIDPRHVNDQDFALLTLWSMSEEGFIKFGRISSKDINQTQTHWVELSDEAWKLAHEERRNRARRTAENRYWNKAREEVVS